MANTHNFGKTNPSKANPEKHTQSKDIVEKKWPTGVAHPRMELTHKYPSPQGGEGSLYNMVLSHCHQLVKINDYR